MKVTQEEILQMNILYKELGTYAAVSREIGRAPSTVKKYIDPTFEIVDESKAIRFNREDIPTSFSTEEFLKVENIGAMCVLSDEEWKEFYQGDDGTVSCYVDAVNEKISKSSLEKETLPLEDDIKTIFKNIKEKFGK